MTKKIARKLISEQKASLTLDNLRNRVWREKTLLYIRSIFGEPNTESLQEHFYFSPYYAFDYSTISEQELTEKVSNLNALFDVYLITIDNGIFPKQNIFTNDSNGSIFTSIIAALIFFGGLISSWAYTAGQHSSNIKEYDLTKKVELLQDSIKVLMAEKISAVSKNIDSQKYSDGVKVDQGR